MIIIIKILIIKIIIVIIIHYIQYFEYSALKHFRICKAKIDMELRENI